VQALMLEGLDQVRIHSLVVFEALYLKPIFCFRPE